MLERVARSGAVAPALWPLEVLNVLVLAERRKRLSAVQRHELAGFLRELPITLNQETAAQAWGMTARLAEQHRLTLYDAAYLELARRLGLPLATLDQQLRTACGRSGHCAARTGRLNSWR